VGRETSERKEAGRISNNSVAWYSESMKKNLTWLKHRRKKAKASMTKKEVKLKSFNED
jgi:hypothetical protein